ncbi:ABC transporter ATP-binding protein [Azonexus fungiphilus]|uniref:ABC transporter ATP-binding protein n=1 Tax=Azonexus fungiphilus TaxID=146940 RepID=UPI00156B8F5D|nr:ABC transporter ATP-binding protein [Azonexus fungiphilus]NHC07954.1 ABC transporter ATP-binding protein [Azonexus fungiphilus]
MSSEIAIKVENLSKCYQIYDQPRDRLKQFIIPRTQRILGLQPKQYYREFWALSDISFEIKKGETVGVIGRNGSGKSTLLQMICGTLSPTAGSITTLGRIAALLELGAGFNQEFTGRENVYMNASVLGLSNNEIDTRFDEIAAFADIGEFIEQPVKTYSSGMYARLAFSIAINVDPEILIVDEALAVGDTRFVAKCMRRIKDIQARGASILFVSHDVGSVRTLCERAIWLDKGSLVEQGDVFPVTGRFTEYMFSDEKSEQDALHDVLTDLYKEPPLQADATLTGGQATADSSTTATSSASIQAPAEYLPALDARPVTHWGSHKGIILTATIRDEQGAAKDIFAWGEALNILVEVNVPKDISREHLSVAFSIKDLKGTDLIVSTTHDFEFRRLPDKERFGVSFELTNPLVTGKYLLVAAVENRQHRDIHYYEYVEGAHYFASLANERLFGLFQPSIEQQILV